MKDIPIIFSAPMVRALLRETIEIGTGKTMTRRLAWGDETKGSLVKIGCKPSPWQRVKVGDRLWVRESLQCFQRATAQYVADISPVAAADDIDRAIGRAKWVWKQAKLPSIHMPRWASRLTLTVTATKIEPLQVISADECEAEGIESEAWDQAVGYRDYRKPDGWFCTWPGALKDKGAYAPPGEIQRRSFRSLWESLHGAYAWDLNPDVVALTFAVHEQNIDALPKAEAA